jgi:hypothetical protein
MNLRPLYRVTVFVPRDHFEQLLAAVHAALPQSTSSYDHLAWWSDATEQFRPRDGAHPTRGEIGTVERVASVRLELSIARDETTLDRLLTAIRQNHPWEEPAVFVDETSAPPPA